MGIKGFSYQAHQHQSQSQSHINNKIFYCSENLKNVYLYLLTHLLSIEYFANIVSISYRHRKSDIEASLTRSGGQPEV